MPASARLSRVLLALALAVLAMSVPPAVAQVSVPVTRHASAAVAPPGDPGRLMLVLDSSGSMAEPASGGGTKIEAAKQALRTVIGQLPAAAPVGLRVYGASVFSRDEPGACTDSERVVDLGVDNRDALSSAVEGYQPFGETPIGYALQEAGKDLGSEGKRSIVLVSDGEPTCPPDPCQVAAELAAQGVDLRIDVVGLDVSGKAEEALRCIAEKGHGTYHDADSAQDLVDALATLATRAVRPYEPTGQPVTGSAEPTGAPVVTSGSYVDEIGGPGTASGVRHYTIERAAPGSSITASASILTPVFASDEVGADAFDGVEVALLDDTGQTCDTRTDGTMRSDQTPLTSVSVTDAGCADADTLTLVVSRLPDGQAYTTPLELVVSEEDPVADTTTLPAAAAPAWVVPPAGKPSGSVVGGSSFATATPLAPGVYRGTLVPNEVQVFAVDATWGQQVSATMTVPAPSGKLVDELSQHGSPFSLDLFSPTRANAFVRADGGPAEQWSLYPTGGGEVGGTTARVAYLNREDADQSVAAAAMAGSYSVVVSLIDDAATTSYEVPFVLRVGVTGEVTGAPEYVVASAGPTATGSPSAATTEPTADDSEPAEPEQATGVAAAESDGESSGSGTMIAAVGGAALLAALGGFVLLRRRSARQGGS